MPDSQCSAVPPEDESGALDRQREQRLSDLVGSLTLEEKVHLLTGRDFWTTTALERIGLRPMLFSDGPSGVRGELWDERFPSVSFPSATALSSSWDRGIARRYGAAVAVEARSKGVDVVLGPTINLHRSPLAGRHFESFSEDPVLTGDLAAAYVQGAQDNGVAATPKHYVANDSETERLTLDVRVGERPLRELYLRAFEKAVTDAGAWAVMSSYNSINGVTSSENDLLETPLKSEWGFDGVVVSDWLAVRSIASANAAQDLAMPGPDGAWGSALVDAVHDGRVPVEAVDEKVLRILRLAARVGALGGFEPAAADPSFVEDPIAFARTASAAGTVLVRNAHSELPWNPDAIASVAVIGQNALTARSQGGGSATVVPEHVVSPLEGIRAAFPDSTVEFSLGAIVSDGVADIPLDRITDPDTGAPGVTVRFLDAAGVALLTEQRRSTQLLWFEGAAPLKDARTLEIRTRFVPSATERLRLGVAVVGRSRIHVDDALLLDVTIEPVGDDLGAALLAPPAQSAPLDVTEGVAVDLRVEYEIGNQVDTTGALGITFGFEPADSDGDRLIADAVEAARQATVAVVVVGTNSAVESEGFDRVSLDLPGRQDELVHAVAAANSRTVVLVNAGAPVLLPWRDEVAAVLIGYFGGQEVGHALADMLTGAAEPGGRLPTTWPASIDDVPVLDTTPRHGTLTYDEGVHIGYRAWLRSEAEPAFPFGAGEGYADFAFLGMTSPVDVGAEETFTSSVTVSNTSARSGKVVVQIYAERDDSTHERPARWLVGFASQIVAAGETAAVDVAIDSRLLAVWDDGWIYEPGTFVLRAGSSVVDLPLRSEVTLPTGIEKR
ncbi:glycosyl hydrolase [Rathayibacter sp. AY2B7]|uniref:beta-glucosidase family protein n=1 Tax=Rathayibacter sp. AY2B7 TaxID=2080571 RepID=UPI000CE78E8C|nr:glycoside hydrolase family 3 C-terminal domain-containing protein [Rathayibacter sp. AY2B7]PPG56841.1 glycosyl hydrolase [Rathayibacter sp. AY2B7]